MPDITKMMDYGTAVQAFREREKEAAGSLVPDYAAWRESAEIQLDHLQRCRYAHEEAISQLSRQIEELENVMANGASNGTAWLRHTVKIQP